MGSNIFYGCSALTDIYVLADYYDDYCKMSELSSYTIIAYSPYSIMTTDSTLYMATTDGNYTATSTPINFGDVTSANSTVTHLYIDSAVTTLPDDAFSYFTALEEVIFASGINLQTIGEYAFAYCDALETIDIPDSVTSIGKYAFAYCDALEIIDIPDSVTSIGNSAFVWCTSLTTVTLGDGVETIGDSAFSYCKALTSVDIPDSVETISDSAFAYCEKLISVTIGDGAKTLGNATFQNCYELTSVTIGDSVETIGNKAFYYCTALTSVTIGDSVETIGNQAFQNCTALTSVTIGDNVETIGDYAFRSTVLTSITIPDSVTSLGAYAFQGCNALTSVTFDGDVPTTLGTDIFDNCNLTSGGIYVLADYYDNYYNATEFNSYKSYIKAYSPYAIMTTDGKLYMATTDGSYTATLMEITSADGFGNSTTNNTITHLYISSAVTELPDNAFYNFTALEVVEFDSDSSLTSIGEYAFYNCSVLTSIDIPDSVTSIGEYAFYKCSVLTSIDIPNSVTSIDKYAFAWCTSLTSIDIPDSITSIGDGAFSKCTSLTSITIPDSVTSIGNSAFYNCTALTSVTIPDSVTSIAAYAFYYCTALTSVTIPDSVISIDYNAFYYCTKLESIIFRGAIVPSFGTSIFNGCTILKYIYVPYGSGSDYETASNFTTYASDIIEYAQYALVDTDGNLLPADDSYTKISDPDVVILKEYLIGVCFETDYTLTGDWAYDNIVIANGCTLTIDTGATLTINKGGSITNNGTVVNNGTIIVSDGATVSGTGTFKYYKVTADDVTLTKSSFDYTGSAITPEYIVVQTKIINGVTYTLDMSNYDVTYEDNIDVGTGKVIFTNKDDTTDTFTKEFTIKAVDTGSGDGDTDGDADGDADGDVDGDGDGDADGDADTDVEQEENTTTKNPAPSSTTTTTTDTVKSYEVTQGKNLIINEYDIPAIFKTEMEYRLLYTVLLNGVLLPKEHYTSKEGSTIIELSADYIATLPNGLYKLSILGSDNSVTDIMFYIDFETSANPTTSESTNPQTGDSWFSKLFW